MIVATFTNSVNSLTKVFSLRCSLRQLLAFGTVVLGILLFSPLTHLPSSSFAGAQTQMQLNKESATSIRRRTRK